jgi:predicted protein tyrosine phosphatase
MNELVDCYWVEEGRLLAGEYPGVVDEEEARQRIVGLEELGVTLFVDLTEPSESDPYEAFLADGVRAIRKPISDFTAPSPEEMRAILDLIEEDLAAGSVIYLHCLGGVGRTGTVVGCHLVRHGTPPQRALEALARLRSRARSADSCSPENDEQRALIESWARGG